MNLKKFYSALLILSVFGVMTGCSERVAKQDSSSFINAKFTADKNTLRSNLRAEFKLLDDGTKVLSSFLKIILEALDGSNLTIDEGTKIFIKDGKIEGLLNHITSSDLGEINIDSRVFKINKKVIYSLGQKKRELIVYIDGTHENGKILNYDLKVGNEVQHRLYKKDETQSKFDLKAFGDLIVDLHGEVFDLRDLNLSLDLDVDLNRVSLTKLDNEESLEVKLFSDNAHMVLSKLDISIVKGKLIKPKKGDVEVSFYSTSDNSLLGKIDHEGLKFSFNTSSKKSDLDLNFEWDQIK